MRIAHISDPHLGFRTYSARTRNGWNQREADVVHAFRRIVDDVIEWGAHMVVYPGDFFDSSRPSYAVFTEAQRQTKRIDREDIVQVFVGGNHDHPRIVQDGHAFLALAECLQHAVVILNEPQAVEIPMLDTVVFGMPHGTYPAERILASAEMASKLSKAEHRVCAIHAPIEVRGENRLLYAKMSDDSIPAEVLKPERWTYLAAGDFHEFLEFAPNACYAGSIEYVNAGPWIEARDSAPPKGYVRFDTDVGQIEHVPIETRPVFDLDPIECEPGWGPQELLDVILSRLWELPGEGGRIIRQRVRGCSREMWDAMDHESISEVRAHELHYHLIRETERREDAEEAGDGGIFLSSNEADRAATLREEMTSFIDTEWEPGGGVDRDAVKEYATEILPMGGPE